MSAAMTVYSSGSPGHLSIFRAGLCVVAGLAVWLAIGGAAQAAPVSGSVLDGQTLEPIAGARIYVPDTPPAAPDQPADDSADEQPPGEGAGEQTPGDGAGEQPPDEGAGEQPPGEGAGDQPADEDRPPASADDAPGPADDAP
ncbi:MAG: hypothetical protein AAGC55_22100, partial [Myxococcota bacterium]